MSEQLLQRRVPKGEAPLGLQPITRVSVELGKEIKERKRRQERQGRMFMEGSRGFLHHPTHIPNHTCWLLCARLLHDNPVLRARAQMPPEGLVPRARPQQLLIYC